jgi:hypothetical protein
VKGCTAQTYVASRPQQSHVATVPFAENPTQGSVSIGRHNTTTAPEARLTLWVLMHAGRQGQCHRVKVDMRNRDMHAGGWRRCHGWGADRSDVGGVSAEAGSVGECTCRMRSGCAERVSNSCTALR